MSTMQRTQATTEWQATIEKRATTRSKRRRYHAFEQEVEECSCVTKDNHDDMSLSRAPAMTILKDSVAAQAAILSTSVARMSGNQHLNNDISALDLFTLEGPDAKDLDNEPAHQEHVPLAGFVSG